MNRSPASLILGLLGLLLAGLMPLDAETTSNAEPLTPQRRLFLAAEQALERGDQERFGQLRAQLIDYPLLPYLDYQALGEAPERAQAESFIERYPETPLAQRVRRGLVERLAGAGDWQGVLATYRPTPSSTQRCHYLTALWRQGQAEHALGEVNALWLSAEADPNACEGLFTDWIHSGHLTTDQVWRRIALAMAQGNTRLASALERYLPSGDQAWLRLWMAIQRDPRQLVERLHSLGPHPQRIPILVEGIRRLAAQDPAVAAVQWATLGSEDGLTEADRCAVNSALALARARTDAPGSLTELDRLGSCLTTPRQREERLRVALRASDWARLRCWIEALPDEEQHDELWRYWQARALQALGDGEVAALMWEALAQERSYYGFLAADRSDHPYRIAHRPLMVDPEVEQRLAALAVVRRAQELLALNRTVPARREWQLLIEDLPPSELQAAARLAQRWEWHDQAILALARAGFWDDLELRFPLAHGALVAEAASREQLEPAWIFAVLRQESAFATDLRSPAGAIGLMQLLPATANEVAREQGQGRITPLALTQPRLNVALGSAYLAKLHRRLGGHPLLATAAYNAGAARVAGWLPKGPLAADLWVELIPLRETRQYVQRVLTYEVIYRHRLGQVPLALARWMIPIQPDQRQVGPMRAGQGDHPPRSEGPEPGKEGRSSELPNSR